MFVAAWLLCALCCPEGEEKLSTSHAPAIPKGKAVAEPRDLCCPLPGSPNCTRWTLPTAQRRGPSSPYMCADLCPLSVANLLCHPLTSLPSDINGPP